MVSSLDLALLRLMTMQICIYRPYASCTNGDVQIVVTKHASQRLTISLVRSTLELRFQRNCIIIAMMQRHAAIDHAALTDTLRARQTPSSAVCSVRGAVACDD